MSKRSTGLSRRARLMWLATFPLLSGCATHCGLFIYCDVPKDWPLNDTFTVDSNTSSLCISGARRWSCASKGMFQSGTRAVELRTNENDDEDSGGELIATLNVTGAAGDEFFATCFEYNGNTVLGFTEVLIGAEIRNRSGRLVAKHPFYPVTRRSNLIPRC